MLYLTPLDVVVTALLVAVFAASILNSVVVVVILAALPNLAANVCFCAHCG